MTRGIEDTFLSFVEAVEAAEIPYVIVGGFAVAAWGDPRGTRDVDALVEIDDEEMPKLVEELAARDLTVDPRDIRDAMREGGHATVFDEHSIFHVDLKPAVDEVTRASIRGGVRMKLLGVEVVFSAPEDVVAHKLRFGSDRDIEDAETILERQRDRIDLPALRERCQELGVLDRLEAVRERLGA